ncbi:MAG: hypothetical protein R6U98_35635 [Pirellulaceae bacterium]
MESRPTQAVLPLVGLAAEKIIRDRYVFQAVGFFRMARCPTQAVLPLVGLAAEKVIRDRYKPYRCSGRLARTKRLLRPCRLRARSRKRAGSVLEIAFRRKPSFACCSRVAVVLQPGMGNNFGAL